jgi:hypothetical protein
MYWVEKFNNLCCGKTIKSIIEIDVRSANTCIEITFVDESKVTLEWDYMYDILFSNGNIKEIIM